MKAVLLLFTLLAIATRLAASAPNILIILTDDHSNPLLGVYDKHNLRTPVTDQLAAEGMVFGRFYTSAPQCVPSRAAMVTGRSSVAARMSRFSSNLPPDEITFFEILRAQAGYHTGIVGRNYHLDGSWGDRNRTVGQLNQKHGLVTFPKRVDHLHTGPDLEAIEQMRLFLDQRPAERPFCLWLNFLDPHHPWTAPAEDIPDPASLKLPPGVPDLPGVRADLAAHIGEIHRLDRHTGTLLALLAERGLADNTVVIFTGDNGSALPRGKGSLHELGTRVPFIIRWPGVVRPGAASDALLTNDDIAPTLLEAVGLPPHPRMRGRSFLGLLKGDPAYSPNEYIFTSRGPHGRTPVSMDVTSRGYDLSRAVRGQRYKLIYNATPWVPYEPVDSSAEPGWTGLRAAHAAGTLDPVYSRVLFTTPRPVYELYDLETDPGELENLSGRPELREVEQALRLALVENMIVEFDHLPLPDFAEK